MGRRTLSPTAIQKPPNVQILDLITRETRTWCINLPSSTNVIFMNQLPCKIPQATGGTQEWHLQVSLQETHPAWNWEEPWFLLVLFCFSENPPKKIYCQSNGDFPWAPGCPYLSKGNSFFLMFCMAFSTLRVLLSKCYGEMLFTGPVNHRIRTHGNLLSIPLWAESCNRKGISQQLKC